MLADDFARNGFYTVVPDYLESDPIPPFDQHEKLGFNRETWAAKHTAAQLRPILDKTIATNSPKRMENAKILIANTCSTLPRPPSPTIADIRI